MAGFHSGQWGARSISTRGWSGTLLVEMELDLPATANVYLIEQIVACGSAVVEQGLDNPGRANLNGLGV